jgi:hypothetical protein
MLWPTILSLALATPARALPAEGPARGLQQVIPSGASVAPAGDDAVYLKNGGMIRGTILEILPNDHVTLQLATGQTAMVEWSQVLRVEQHGRAPPPQAPAKRTAFVHIESDRPVRLEAVEGRKSYRFVCTSPCDMEVDLGEHYRIAGDGVRATSDFELNAQQGQRVLIDVETSSKAGFVWGIVVVSVSPVVSLVGLVVYAISSTGPLSSSSGQTVGAAMGFGGLIGIALGTVLIASNASSKATQGPLVPQAPPPRESSDNLRLPTPAIVSTPVLRF